MWTVLSTGSLGVRNVNIYGIALRRSRIDYEVVKGTHGILIDAHLRRSCVRLLNTSTNQAGPSVQKDINKKQDHSYNHQNNNEDEEDRRRRKQRIWSFINFITWVPGLIWFVRHIGSVGAITGQSMSPTLNPIPGDKDLVILNKYASYKFWYKIGDVIMLISPNDPNLILCKRILALPGDIVSVEDPGQLKNGQKGKKIRIRIPPSHVWVEGDKSVLDAQASNAGHGFIRPSSRDSRDFGPVPIGLITARVDMILWPPSRFGMMPNRPNFDVAKVRLIHEARNERTKQILPANRGGRSHPDDSSLSPYAISEWEWSTDSHGSKGVKGHSERLKDMIAEDDSTIIEKATLSQAAEKKRARQERREANQKASQRAWNQISRGGRLGDDAMSAEED